MPVTDTNADADADESSTLAPLLEDHDHRLPTSPALYIIRAAHLPSGEMECERALSSTEAIKKLADMIDDDDLDGAVAYRIGNATDVTYEFKEVIE